MEIVDLQLHEPAPFEDWSGVDDAARRRVMTEALWQSMDAVGVDAVVVNPLEDSAWVDDLATRFPGRVAHVPICHRSDFDKPDIEAHMAKLYETPGVLAIRFGLIASLQPDLFAFYDSGGYDGAFAACQKLGAPIWLEVMGGVGSVERVARLFPDLQIIIDHIGLNQPPYQPRDIPPWKDLPIVLDLAQYKNVAIKVCAPISLSDEPYPFADAWPPVARLLEAFGPERLAWASDIQRTRGRSGYQVRLHAAATVDAPARYTWGPDAHVPGPPPNGPDYPGKHTYMDSLAFFLYNDQLSVTEKEQILGQTTRRLLKWPRAGA